MGAINFGSVDSVRVPSIFVVSIRYWCHQLWLCRVGSGAINFCCVESVLVLFLYIAEIDGFGMEGGRAREVEYVDEEEGKTGIGGFGVSYIYICVCAYEG